MIELFSINRLVCIAKENKCQHFRKKIQPANKFFFSQRKDFLVIRNLCLKLCAGFFIPEPEI